MRFKCCKGADMSEQSSNTGSEADSQQDIMESFLSLLVTDEGESLANVLKGIHVTLASSAKYTKRLVEHLDKQATSGVKK